MNYPVWYLPEIGGNTLIALIAIVHVFISHFAVGGGLYLVLAERKGLREKSEAILDFTHGHSKFFLLVTMVFGGLTGVGIWFIIALVQPAATSLLIHNFVFGWATEWVFFLVEIIALFVYFYSFGRMEARTHQIVGWIYFGAAWGSLFLINGIIDFMLTPGGWLENGDFWLGFFNPTFWPSLFFRTFIALMMAGLFAYVTCAWQKDESLRFTMTRFSGKWVLTALAGGLPSGIWYVAALPEPAHKLVHGGSPTIVKALDWGLYATVAILIISLLCTVILPALHNRLIAFVVLACGLFFMGSFEWTREAARRPYVINEVMYSNGLSKADVEQANAEGFLQSARWSKFHTVDEKNLLEIGEDIYKLQCYACHSLGGFNNDLLTRTANFSLPSFMTYLEKIHERRYFMPPFAGSRDEMRALASWIVGDLHGKSLEQPEEVAAPAAGESVFAENCVFCHDADLIAERTNSWGREKIRSALNNLSALNPAMPDFEGSEAEKEALADYLVTYGQAPTSAPAAGEAIFAENCVFCHEATLITERTNGWGREKIRSALNSLSALNPAMPDFEGSDSDKEALADYLAAFNQAPPPPPVSGETIFAENCVFCHEATLIAERTNGWGREKIRTALNALSTLNPAMPDFEGSTAEKEALADFLFTQTQGGQL
ncbi:MAG: hypothetical protein C0621_07485 [Desulfuromonas sp.]|nr:MAG: hypothetical protein C0621_07485 [Desulfuromonas sp.]